MTTKEKIWPADYHSLSPFLIVKDAARAIIYYQKAFEATELQRMTMPDDKIAFAELKIGDSVLQLVDEAKEQNLLSPKSLGGTPLRLHLYVDDVDKVFKAAIAAGAKQVLPIEDQFYGDRSGSLEDPFGHLWTIATRIEHISRKEMHKRFEHAMRLLPPS